MDGCMGLSEVQVDFFPLAIIMEEIKPVELVSSGKAPGGEGGWSVEIDGFFQIVASFPGNLSLAFPRLPG